MTCSHQMRWTVPLYPYMGDGWMECIYCGYSEATRAQITYVTNEPGKMANLQGTGSIFASARYSDGRELPVEVKGDFITYQVDWGVV